MQNEVEKVAEAIDAFFKAQSKREHGWYGNDDKHRASWEEHKIPESVMLEFDHLNLRDMAKAMIAAVKA